MINRMLANKISRSYVLCTYLRDLAREVGESRYSRSLVRLEHGPGTGFFGVNNTGSSDCAKECFRGVTDALGQNFRDWSAISFRSETCLNLDAPDFRNTHRVEHTWEVAQLFSKFEAEYIIPDRSFSESTLADFIIRHQIVCLIRQDEQLRHRTFNHDRPFSKYTARIYYEGNDVSQASLPEIFALNATRFATLLAELVRFDFTSLTSASSERLHRPNGRHSLPTLQLATEFGLNDLQLVHKHYRLKLQKRTNPSNSRWYSAQDSDRYRLFLAASEADPEE